eukprot:TRINITY_DN26985_c0_g1_i2.p1 TRINITY_DN26985_c0_g1~~TRINITY_DN26985_c0_g1_i2.p1  ORF type:complete len:236 (+),score=2.05 TRINITY_DN26985_c0_g1_i2:45-752(+)
MRTMRAVRASAACRSSSAPPRGTPPDCCAPSPSPLLCGDAPGAPQSDRSARTSGSVGGRSRSASSGNSPVGRPAAARIGDSPALIVALRAALDKYSTAAEALRCVLAIICSVTYMVRCVPGGEELRPLCDRAVCGLRDRFPALSSLSFVIGLGDTILMSWTTMADLIGAALGPEAHDWAATLASEIEASAGCEATQLRVAAAPRGAHHSEATPRGAAPRGLAEMGSPTSPGRAAP